MRALLRIVVPGDGSAVRVCVCARASGANEPTTGGERRDENKRKSERTDRPRNTQWGGSLSLGSLGSLPALGRRFHMPTEERGVM